MKKTSCTKGTNHEEDRPQAKVPRLAPAALDELIGEITVDAYGEDDQFWDFRQALEDHVAPPAEGSVVGEPVLVIAVVAVADVAMAPGSESSLYRAAYRKWMGLAPDPPAPHSKQPKRLTTIGRRPLDPGGSVELAILSLKQKAARCRMLRGEDEITLRATHLWTWFPARSQWSGRTSSGLTPARRRAKRR